MKRKVIPERKKNARRCVKVRYFFYADVALLIAIVLLWYIWKSMRGLFSLLSLLPFFLLWTLMLLFPADVTLEEKDSKATRGKTKVLALLLGSALYPGVRLLFDQEWLELTEIAWKAAPLFAIMLIAYLFRTKEWRKKMWMLVVPMVTLAIFSTAFVGLVNAEFDFKPPVQIVSQVVDKQEYHHAKSGTTYYLEVPLEDEQESFRVSRELYSQYEIGDEIIINIGSGALGIVYARVAR